MNEPDSTSTASPAIPGAPRHNGLLEWLLRPGELSQARADANAFSGERAELLRRAKLALELGDQVRAQGYELRTGTASALALDLFRQAAYWALRAHGENPSEREPRAVFSGADPGVLARTQQSPAKLTELAGLFSQDFIALADGGSEGQRAAATQLRKLAKRFIREAERVPARLEWLKLKRGLRLFLVLSPVWLLPTLLFLRSHRDLARGVPWRTSSTLFTCQPEKRECGGAPTSILFHTKRDNQPWFQYDFGKPISFSSLTVRNRTDYCQECALPLVAEVSDDGKRYREISRRSEDFLTWRPSFATTRARYLRLRVLNTTYLHLEAVKVHP